MALNGFSKNIFADLDGVYKDMAIKADDQILESEIMNFADISSPEDMKNRIEKIKQKFEKIKAQIQNVQEQTMRKYQTEMKELLSKKSEEKKKQLEVLTFMNHTGFDKIPKELSDSIIAEIQGETLKIPGLDMNIKNIDLKNGNFGEDAIHQ